MRLINLYTYEFREFHRWDIPQYAILSHCWSKGEVSYSSFSKWWAAFVDIRHRMSGLVSLKQAGGDTGYDKIVAFCRAARTNPARAWDETALECRDTRLEWAWIDTCCIDVRSSAELSEGIQSMYPFYEFSAVCYAYLADVPGGSPAVSKAFRASRWFKRGWTLQELLAPWDVIFYDQQWKVIGHKCTHHMDDEGYCRLPIHFYEQFGPGINEQISRASGIAPEYLETPKAPLEASIACRMSWAARRETKRVEDNAYCLLGIFDVNIPLLYGEGRRAFVRLQHEIMQESNDTSIFAWAKASGGTGESVLATSPADFAGCRDVRRLTEENVTTFALTKRGIDYRGLAAKWDDQTFVLQLNCCSQDGNPLELAVSTSKDVTGDTAQFSRVCCDTEDESESPGPEQRIVESSFPRNRRQPEQMEMLYLRASGALLRTREIRHLCHDLEAIDPDAMPTKEDLEAMPDGLHIEALDLDNAQARAVWRHIGPVYEDIMISERRPLVDVDSSELKDRRLATLNKARQLATVAAWHARRFGRNV